MKFYEANKAKGTGFPQFSVLSTLGQAYSEKKNSEKAEHYWKLACENAGTDKQNLRGHG